MNALDAHRKRLAEAEAADEAAQALARDPGAASLVTASGAVLADLVHRAALLGVADEQANRRPGRTGKSMATRWSTEHLPFHRYVLQAAYECGRRQVRVAHAREETNGRRMKYYRNALALGHSSGDYGSAEHVHRINAYHRAMRRAPSDLELSVGCPPTPLPHPKQEDDF